MNACAGLMRRIAALTQTSLVVVALLVTPAPDAASASPRDDQKRVRSEVARASSILEGATSRARTAARRLASANAALPAARDRVAETRGRVAAATAAANSAARTAGRAQAVVTAASRRYADSVRRVVVARERVTSFVTAAYKGGDIVSLNVLLGSRTAQDVTQRAGYVDRILTVEQESVAGLVAARRAVKQNELDAELARRVAERARRAAESALTAARTTRIRAAQAVADLTILVGQRTRALGVAQEERAESLARYRRAKAQAARIEAELRAWERRRWRHGGPVLRPGARFLMPVRGWKSSDFGMRFDPFFRVWQLHGGVDIAADGGEPIFAAASGRVIRAGYDGGYGNLTCVSHGRYLGKGVSTCYAHQSRILVSAGQHVRRGQVIGRVGTTGASTGNHLHFEVRIDGSPAQPLAWLPHCLC